MQARSSFSIASALRRGASLAAFVAAGLVLAAPAVHAAERDSWFSNVGWNSVNGSGKVVTETRAITGFQAVALRGAMDLVLRQGGREGVELRGDDNILPLIETRVVDIGGVPTLEIGSAKGANYSTRTTIVVTVDVKTISKLSLSGSGNVSGDALKAPTLSVKVSGSGDLRLKRVDTDELTSTLSGSGNMEFTGRAPRASFSIAGSGNVDAVRLEGDDVNITIAGSGDASVTARKTLAVKIAGSGGVTYSGDAAVTTSVAGSGSIRKR